MRKSIFRDITNQRFGRLVAMRPLGKDNGRCQIWLCLCDCGKTKEITGRSLWRKQTVSCGCFGIARRKEAVTTHGKSKTPIYRIWSSMIDRCHNPNSNAYSYYGGRGIIVCNRWRRSFQKFLDDLGIPPSSKHSIDRVNNNGDYCPSNCRWVTRKEQMKNTRRNVWITFRGETLLVADWAERLQIRFNTLKWRLKKWGIEKALTTVGARTKSGTLRSHCWNC